MMNKDELLYLLERIADRAASEEEIAQYNSWCDGFRKQDVEIPDMEAIKSGMLSHIHQHIDSGAKIRRIPVRRYIGVAAAVIGIAIGVYFYTSRHLEGSEATRDLVAYKNDIGPGSNKATMIVNGKSTELSDAKTGVVFAANNVKYTDGTEVNNSPLPSDVSQITLVTQRGGMYSTILPDGSKAWLNAASELEFPSTFANVAQRIVKTKGEVYFEVAKNKKQPFIVLTGGQRIEVLGTHFNVSAYKGEGIRTTLLEGSVKVASLSAMGRTELASSTRQKGNKNSELNVASDREVLLKPNQQSLITGTTGITVAAVNASEAVAWKNGYFRFYDTDLETFMTTIARWYDIEVSYQGGISQYKDLAFGGSVSRSKNISEVLKILAQTGKVHYKIEGRKVIITR